MLIRPAHGVGQEAIPGALGASCGGSLRCAPEASLRRARTDLIRIGSTSPSYTLVFIHGFAMHADPYADPIAEIVGDEGEARLYDLPGHGGRSGRVTRAALSRFFDEIAATVPDEPRPVVLAAESLGCAHVEDLSRRLAEQGRRVDGVVLLAPPLLVNPVTLTRWLIDALRRSPGQILRGRLSIRRPIAESVSDPQWRRRLLADPKVRTSVDLRYVLRTAYDIAQMGAELRRITPPTILLQGSRDPLILPASLAASHRLCGAEDKRKVMIEGAAHSLLWDVRTPQVIAHVREWLGRLLG